MKLATLVSDNCVGALRKLRESKPPARLAFRFLRLWDAVEPILREYEEQRLELLRRYARSDDNGATFRFQRADGTQDTEAIVAFLAEHSALLEEETNLPEMRFSLEELEQFGAGLTVAEYDALRWLADVGEIANT